MKKIILSHGLSTDYATKNYFPNVVRIYIVELQRRYPLPLDI